MQHGARLIGTHIEGSLEDGGVGLWLTGESTYIETYAVGAFDTDIQVGDGTAADVHGYFIDASCADANNGILITAGGDRRGHGRLYFATCTYEVNDLRAATDLTYNSLRDIDDYRVIYQIDDNAKTITIVRVKHRREAYR
jgi:hypothetical protein